MIKQAPTTGRLVVIVAFALSCFGLTLFLWKTFGGSVPLEPQRYRVEVAFTEATQFAVPIDVRASGVTVGQVVHARVDPATNRTIATIELDREYAPLSRSARAVLRQKTLQGERYVELTLGDRHEPKLPDGGRLPDGRVRRSVELDEVLSAFDHSTRRSFQVWQQAQAGAVRGRGEDLNDALGSLPAWASSATDLLGVLNEQKANVRRLFRNTGVVFSALARDQGRLRKMMVASDRVFGATASEDHALAKTFRTLPTFLDESKRTLADIETFSALTDPVVQKLRPAVRELRPTLRAARQLAPPFRTTFTRLRQLIGAGRTGLPALRDTLSEMTPLLAQVQPFLEEVNPVLRWFEYLQPSVTDMLGTVAATNTWKVPTLSGVPGHVLPIFGVSGPDNAITYANRPPKDRGNAYRLPTAWTGAEYFRRQIAASSDCDNTGRPGDGSYQTKLPDTDDDPSCWLQPPPLMPFGNARRLPHIEAADYSAK